MRKHTKSEIQRDCVMSNNEMGMTSNNEMGMTPNNEMGMTSNNEMGMTPNNEVGMTSNNDMGNIVPGTSRDAPRAGDGLRRRRVKELLPYRIRRIAG